MARSRWKFVSFSKFVWRQIFVKKYFDYYPNLSMIYSRGSSIPKCFSALSSRIHKGNTYSKMFIFSYTKGYKFGEFSFTRKPYHFPKKKNRK